MDVMERDRLTSSDIESHLWSLRVCEELVPQGEDGEYPAERGEQCLALIKVMRHLFWKQSDLLVRMGDEQGKQYPFIGDDKFENW
jgi:hypothetical protein